MSREIKFRVWIKPIDTGKEPYMVYPPSLDVAENQVLLLNGIMLFLTEDVLNDTAKVRAYLPGQTVLMQYTGLKDKNGTDVYEGDKLRCYFNRDEIEDWLWATLTETMLKQGYFDKEVTIPEIYQEALPEKIEVIGNIYQNKELLS